MEAIMKDWDTYLKDNVKPVVGTVDPFWDRVLAEWTAFKADYEETKYAQGNS